jgi:cellulose synthase/poly-beta-1,6-N-acetylglucosamine synthase-like glycosyltransferase
MPEVPKTRAYYVMQLNLFWQPLFMESVIFGGFVYHFYCIGTHQIIHYVIGHLKKEKKKKTRRISGFGILSESFIIVPAYNEEVNIVSSLNNLLKQTYPNFNIILVDDGSKDSTYEKAKEAFSDHPKLKIFTKTNGGKATALNFGISQTDAEYVVCIDADTKLEQDAVKYLIARFLNSIRKKKLQPWQEM